MDEFEREFGAGAMGGTDSIRHCSWLKTESPSKI